MMCFVFSICLSAFILIVIVFFICVSLYLFLIFIIIILCVFKCVQIDKVNAPSHWISCYPFSKLCIKICINAECCHLASRVEGIIQTNTGRFIHQALLQLAVQDVNMLHNRINKVFSASSGQTQAGYTLYDFRNVVSRSSVSD